MLFRISAIARGRVRKPLVLPWTTRYCYCLCASMHSTSPVRSAEGWRRWGSRIGWKHVQNTLAGARVTTPFQNAAGTSVGCSNAYLATYTTHVQLVLKRSNSPAHREHTCCGLANVRYMSRRKGIGVVGLPTCCPTAPYPGFLWGV